MPFENIVGKGENAGNQHFLFFPQFSLRPKQVFSFIVIFILSSANAFNLDETENQSFGKDLRHIRSLELQTIHENQRSSGPGQLAA